jgi:hypothetical protein
MALSIEKAGACCMLHAACRVRAVCGTYMVGNEQVRPQALREVVAYACLLSAEEMRHGVVLRGSWLCAQPAVWGRCDPLLGLGLGLGRASDR